MVRRVQSIDLNIDLIGWLAGRILCHINPCELFNAKSCYIYIYMICKGIVVENFISKRLVRGHLFANN